MLHNGREVHSSAINRNVTKLLRWIVDFINRKLHVMGNNQRCFPFYTFRHQKGVEVFFFVYLFFGAFLLLLRERYSKSGEREIEGICHAGKGPCGHWWYSG